jgi:hypothetical protein
VIAWCARFQASPQTDGGGPKKWVVSRLAPSLEEGRIRTDERALLKSLTCELSRE